MSLMSAQNRLPEVVEEVFRHSWILLVLVTSANGLIWWIRSKKFVRARPELLPGYRKLVRGWLVWANLPWLVMGVGSTVGGIPSGLHIFRPLDADPFVLAWWASVVLIWIMGTFWLFTGGAEELSEHPGLLNPMFGGNSPGPRMIKVMWCACLLGGVLGTVMCVFRTA